MKMKSLKYLLIAFTLIVSAFDAFGDEAEEATADSLKFLATPKFIAASLQCLSGLTRDSDVAEFDGSVSYFYTHEMSAEQKKKKQEPLFPPSSFVFPEPRLGDDNKVSGLSVRAFRSSSAAELENFNYFSIDPRGKIYEGKLGDFTEVTKQKDISQFMLTTVRKIGVRVQKASTSALDYETLSTILTACDSFVDLLSANRAFINPDPIEIRSEILRVMKRMRDESGEFVQPTPTPPAPSSAPQKSKPRPTPTPKPTSGVI